MCHGAIGARAAHSTGRAPDRRRRRAGDIELRARGHAFPGAATANIHTHMQRAVRFSACLCALGLLAAALACGGSESGGAQPAGERLYSEKGCANCHGRAGEGTFMGPPLRNLAAHWQREELAKFFLDPSGYAKGQPRLAEMMKAYRMPMTPIVASEADRLLLADHVLGMK